MNGDETSSEDDDDHGSIPNRAPGVDGGNGPEPDPPDVTGNPATLSSPGPRAALDDDPAVIQRGTHASATTVDASRTDTTTAFGNAGASPEVAADPDADGDEPADGFVDPEFVGEMPRGVVGTSVPTMGHHQPPAATNPAPDPTPDPTPDTRRAATDQPPGRAEPQSGPPPDQRPAPTGPRSDRPPGPTGPQSDPPPDRPPAPTAPQSDPQSDPPPDQRPAPTEPQSDRPPGPPERRSGRSPQPPAGQPERPPAAQPARRRSPPAARPAQPPAQPARPRRRPERRPCSRARRRCRRNRCRRGAASGSADAACWIVSPPAAVTPEIALPRSPRLTARASLVPAKNETATTNIVPTPRKKSAQSCRHRRGVSGMSWAYRVRPAPKPDPRNTPLSRGA